MPAVTDLNEEVVTDSNNQIPYSFDFDGVKQCVKDYVIKFHNLEEEAIKNNKPYIEAGLYSITDIDRKKDEIKAEIFSIFVKALCDGESIYVDYSFQKIKIDPKKDDTEKDVLVLWFIKKFQADLKTGTEKQMVKHLDVK